MASMSGGRLKYLRNGYTMLEMTKEFDKWLIYLRNGFTMLKMIQEFDKRGNDLIICQTA